MRVVETLAGEGTITMSRGSQNAAAVSDGGDIYTWGDGRSGEFLSISFVPNDSNDDSPLLCYPSPSPSTGRETIDSQTEESYSQKIHLYSRSRIWVLTNVS